MDRGLRVRAVGLGLAALLATAVLDAAPAAGATITPPGAPTDLQYTSSGTSITLTWDAPADTGSQPIEYYDVQEAQSPNPPESVQQDDDVAADPLTATITGLTYNTYYNVTVAANNGAEGPTATELSVIVYPIVVTKDVADLAAARPHTVGYRRSLVETTRMTKAGSLHHLPGLKVELLGSPDGATYHLLGSTTTDSSGRAQVTIHPTKSLVVEWRFAGNDQYAAVTSMTARLSVANIVKAKLSRKRVRAGHRVAVFGTVTPTSKGQTVGVYQLISKGGVVSVAAYLGSATIKRQRMPSGHTETGFLAHIKTTSSDRGRFLLEVLGPQESIRERGFSKRLHLTVT